MQEDCKLQHRVHRSVCALRPGYIRGGGSGDRGWDRGRRIQGALALSDRRPLLSRYVGSAAKLGGAIRLCVARTHTLA